MAAKKGGLGKGLDSLIADKVSTKPVKKVEEIQEFNGEKVEYLDILKVEPNKEQPRKNFDEDAILELSESIKIHGIIQPLLVQKRADYYEIIAGERRWRAAKKAGLKEVPAIVKEYIEREIAEISLIENIQREDLNPIEEAQAYKKLLTEYNLKQDELADRISKNRTTITNTMRLLKLDERVQKMVIDDQLTTGHARALLGIGDQEKQFIVAQKIFDERLSVRETEKLIKKIQKEKEVAEQKNKEQEEKLDFIYKDLEEKLKSAIGTKVTIKQKSKDSGKIEIDYYSIDELERIMALLQSVHK